MPFLAYAQSTVSNGLQTSGLQSIFGTGGLNSSQSLSDLIANVIRVLLIFAGVIAIVFVIIGGYQYIVSGGNEETAEKGKKTLINAIIGIVVIVLAYAIINVIVNLVGSSSGYGF
jgi:heme/copper-type cytochrome/quinol oxidase subunit 2